MCDKVACSVSRYIVRSDEIEGWSMISLRRVAAATLGLAVLAGCGGAPVREGASASSGAKLHITSCGQQMEFPRPAHRIVSLDQSTTETLLALKAHNAIAGVANVKMPVPAEYQDAYRGVKVLNPKVLTGEQLRAATPDVVATSFRSFFTANQVGTREELNKAGIPSYISAVDCAEYSPAKNAFDRLADDYRNLGQITGHTTEANQLVAQQQAAVNKAKQVNSAGRRNVKAVFVYSAYDGQPYVAGNRGIPQAMADFTGVQNVFSDTDDVWPEVQWEQVAARNPDVIVLGDLSERGFPGDTGAEKIRAFKTNPATKHLDAVKNDRFIVVDGLGLDPSPRATKALADVATGLSKLGYAK